MSETFTKGQRVICVNNTGVHKALTKGSEYVVENVTGKFVRLRGLPTSYKTRFEAAPAPSKKPGFKVGGKAVCTSKSDPESILQVGAVYDVLQVSRAAVLLADVHGYKQVTIAKRWLSPYEDITSLPVVQATAAARWFVIDKTKDTLVAVDLKDRQAGIDWVQSYGNVSHRYIVAKETGEFTVSRTVAEV